MEWVLGSAVLVAFGVVLRRLLRMDGSQSRPSRSGRTTLNSSREDVYLPLALELETQAAILGISLNEAFEERDSGHPEIAWRFVRLSASEWGRLAEIVVVMLDLVAEYMPVVHVVVPGRTLVADRFKSQIMIDSIRMHEVVSQLVFRSKLRFNLHIRTLRRAVETLTVDFRQTCRSAEEVQDPSPDLWRSFDFEAHDFDLLTKEALLAFRAFLLSLHDSDVAKFGAELKAVMPRGVRAVAVLAEK